MSTLRIINGLLPLPACVPTAVGESGTGAHMQPFVRATIAQFHDRRVQRLSTLFGSVMEQLAIAVCRREFGGRKSAAEGLDLEFERYRTRYIISLKSGSNWSNSSQINKIRDYFRKAKKTLGSNAGKSSKVVAVNGCRDETGDR